MKKLPINRAEARRQVKAFIRDARRGYEQLKLGWIKDQPVDVVDGQQCACLIGAALTVHRGFETVLEGQDLDYWLYDWLAEIYPVMALCMPDKYQVDMPEELDRNSRDPLWQVAASCNDDDATATVEAALKSAEEALMTAIPFAIDNLRDIQERSQ